MTVAKPEHQVDKGLSLFETLFRVDFETKPSFWLRPLKKYTVMTKQRILKTHTQGGLWERNWRCGKS